MSRLFYSTVHPFLECFLFDSGISDNPVPDVTDNKQTFRPLKSDKAIIASSSTMNKICPGMFHPFSLSLSVALSPLSVKWW